MMLKTGDFVIIYLFIFVVFKEKLDAYSQGVGVCRVCYIRMYMPK